MSKEQKIEVTFRMRKLVSETETPDILLERVIGDFVEKHKDHQMCLGSYAILRDVAQLAISQPDQLKHFSIGNEKIKQCIAIVNQFEPDLLIKRKTATIKMYEFFKESKSTSMSLTQLFSQFKQEMPSSPPRHSPR